MDIPLHQNAAFRLATPPPARELLGMTNLPWYPHVWHANAVAVLSIMHYDPMIRWCYSNCLDRCLPPLNYTTAAISSAVMFICMVDWLGRETEREGGHGPMSWLTAQQRNGTRQNYATLHVVLLRHLPAWTLPLLPLLYRRGTALRAVPLQR